MKKSLSMLLVIFMMVSLLAACGDGGTSTPTDSAGSESSAASTRDYSTGPIVIGGVNDLSGNRSVTGNGINRGAELAVNEINTNGGILGREVKFVPYDNKNDGQESINAYTRLADVDGASAVVTSDASSICMTLIEISSQKGVPVVGMPSDPRATMDMDTGEPYPYMFLVDQPNAIGQADLIANYVNQNTDLDKAAVFYDQSNAYAVANVEAFVKTWEALGHQVTLTETCNANDQDYKTQLQKIKASDADFIYTPNPISQCVLLVQQANQIGLDIPYVGAMDMMDPFLSLLNDPAMVSKAYFPTAVWMEDSKLDTVAQAYEEAYNEIMQMKSVQGYDAVYIIKAAIEAANSADPEAIRNAIENDIVDLPLLVSDAYTQDPTTHAPKDLGMVICEIDNGVLLNKGFYAVP